MWVVGTARRGGRGRRLVDDRPCTGGGREHERACATGQGQGAKRVLGSAMGLHEWASWVLVPRRGPVAGGGVLGGPHPRPFFLCLLAILRVPARFSHHSAP